MENNTAHEDFGIIKTLDARYGDLARRCFTCRFFTMLGDGNVCRRHSPKAEKTDGWRRQWPYVFDDDWCGDWE